jgi:putative phosphoribosyl transferase
MIFRNREQAGKLLAERLDDLRGQDVVVLGLPRGGVVVAREVAERLGAPLDVLVARKLGAPGYEELAIGAVTARCTRVLNDELLRRLILPPGYLERETDAQCSLALEREQRLRGAREPIPLAGRVVVLVDDGVATGMTMFAAIADAQADNPADIVVAAPVMPPETFNALRRRVGRVVSLAVPEGFMAVGQYYTDFRQVEDAEVQDLLAGATKRSSG